jgi:hypothetical protein
MIHEPSFENRIESRPMSHRIGAGLRANSILRSGWGEPEKGFVWSEGRFASLALPGIVGEHVISISMWAYVPVSGVGQDVLIFIDGILKGLFEVTGKTIIRLTHIWVDDLKPAYLDFYIPSAISPKDAEGVSDLRRLGIALAAVQVGMEDPEAEPTNP